MTEDGHLLALIVNRLETFDARFNRIEDRIHASDLQSSDSRRRVHEKLDAQNIVMHTMDGRLTVVEQSVASAAPSLREYAELKAKAAGAGWLGAKLWRLGGWVIGAAAILYGLRDDISAWWHWLIQR